MSAPPVESASSPARGSPPTRPTLRTAIAEEFRLWRHPKVLLAVLALIFGPSLYVLLYISSVWDPYGKLGHLPAGIVNLDQPVTKDGRTLQLGAETVKTLLAKPAFGFRPYADADAARTAVDAGEIFFALVIPPDFSRRALDSPDPAELIIHLSEGNNFTAAVITRRFGVELAHLINETITRERWAALLDPAAPGKPLTLRAGLAAVQEGGQQLRDGARRLRRDGSDPLAAGLQQANEGAMKLADGTARFTTAAEQISNGMGQVKTAVTTIQSRLPTDAQLGELAQGSTTLASGAHSLTDGLEQLRAGHIRIADGARQLQEGSAKVPMFGGRLSEGAGQLRAGLTTFGEGLQRAAEGSQQLSAGTQRMDAALQPLSHGLVELNAGLATLSAKLPADDQLTLFTQSAGQLRTGSATLADGTKALAAGSQQLAAGALTLEQGADRLASGLDELTQKFDAGFAGASPAKLAAPVTTRFEVASPVTSNGPAFAPYFCALSLWIGAVMMSFVFFLRRLPDSLRSASRVQRWCAKALPLYLLGILQASVVILLTHGTLGLNFVSPGATWLAAILGSVAFVSLVLAFMALLGDAGRLLAVIGLILQLAASGGIYPVELSPSFYQRVHSFLPFTALVKSFRATMFGAFQGHWSHSAVMLGSFLVGAVSVGVLFARWKFVPRANYNAAVEF